MKKVALVAAMVFCAGVNAQEVPPDFVQPGGPGVIVTNPVDAQIQAVHMNYMDVKAQAEAELQARQAAQRKAAQARQRAAAAAAKERARKAAKAEKRDDEKYELEMEMKRLQLREMRARVRTTEVQQEAIAKRAQDMVDVKLEQERAKIGQVAAPAEQVQAVTQP